MPEISSANLHERFSDGGPRYTETPSGDGPFPFPAEPFNTVTAALFIGIVVIWLLRLRGRLLQYPFLCLCLPILLAGGIGGTLYHGTRSARLWFLMDVVPISLLGMIAAIVLWMRLKPTVQHLLICISMLGLLNLFHLAPIPTHWAINLSYASLAVVILTPVAVALIRTRFYAANWVYTSLAFFGLAWACRIADPWSGGVLSMGSHWLWHIFGAATTASLSEYFYRIEKISLRKNSSVNVSG